MSLEAIIERLATSIDMLVDSNQHLANVLRQQLVVQLPTATPGKPEAESGKAVEPTPEKRKPGRPPKSPAEKAADSAAASAEKASPSGTGTATAEAADGGTYADLQRMVPALAEAKGRSAAVALFAKLGVASGKELAEKHPEKIGAAVALFRAALGE